MPSMKPNKNVVSIEELQSLEPEIKDLLKDPKNWKSLDVDYYPPRVERLYTSYKGYRIHIHLIHHTTDRCLYHKHRWPAVFKQLLGRYVMGVTYSPIEINSDDAHTLPTLARFIVSAGCYYEMTQTDCLHFVQPIESENEKYSLSIMVTREGELYEESEIRKEALDRTLNGLTDVRVQEIADLALSKL
jgi:hypothetical protein